MSGGVKRLRDYSSITSVALGAHSRSETERLSRKEPALDQFNTLEQSKCIKLTINTKI
jgi:hypothetical protein